MAMPIPDKTWQFINNQPFGWSGVALTDYRQAMVNIVKGFVDMPLNPWVVVGSSDGSTAGMDSVNRWKPGGTWDINKLVWNSAGSAHSWIVLRQLGLSPLCEILFDLSYTNGAYMTMLWGMSGFSGGSTTARPTATTYLTLYNNTYWLSNGGGGATTGGYTHHQQSTDGECSRMVCMYNDTPILFYMFDKAKNPVSGWTNPVLVTAQYNGQSSVIGIPWYTDTARLNTFTPAGGFGTLYMTGEGFGSYLNYEYNSLCRPNQFSGDFPVYPIGLVSETTGFKGRHGEVYDMWWGPPGTAAATPWGTWPDDSTRKYWSPESMTLPWDGLVSAPGSVPLTRY